MKRLIRRANVTEEEINKFYKENKHLFGKYIDITKIRINAEKIIDENIDEAVYESKYDRDFSFEQYMEECMEKEMGSDYDWADDCYDWSNFFLDEELMKKYNEDKLQELVENDTFTKLINEFIYENKNSIQAIGKEISNYNYFDALENPNEFVNWEFERDRRMGI